MWVFNHRANKVIDKTPDCFSAQTMKLDKGHTNLNIGFSLHVYESC